VSAGWFVTTLAERCAGVWIYLRYVLEAILDGKRSPDDLDTLPDDLAGYCLEQIHSRRPFGSWTPVGLPALATLAALRRPATAAELATFTDAPVEPLREWLEERLRPFLDVTLDSGRRRSYAIRHQSLRDLLHQAALATARVLRDA
jgi:hypothetical protein